MSELIVDVPRLPGFTIDKQVGALHAGANVYVVGGAVRDVLLGRICEDRDWVVTGVTAEQMVLAGFKPVGADFPVFLHPKTQEEYALARTERKSGHGYKGFHFYADPSVTLEQDLVRRDFTINAMVMAADGRVIDPFGGWRDLQTKTFKHVSEAFSEDPLRVLRLARFLARFDGFQVHPETGALCQALVDSGELSALVAERTYAELSRGLAEQKPSKMLAFLSTLKAWPYLLPNVNTCFLDLSDSEAAQLDCLSHAQAKWAFLLGVLCANEVAIKAVAKAWRLPREVLDFCLVVLRVCALLLEPGLHLTVAMLDTFFAGVDVYRKPERLQEALNLVEQLKLVSVHPVLLSMLKAYAACQLDGTYKAGLRAYLAEHSVVPAVQAVADFKAKQIGSLFPL
jgi:tRNA nucleotidyltransferase (CCA-adding enzyme)